MRSSRWFLAGLLATLVGCSDGTGPGTIECLVTSTRVLTVGEHQILDPSQDGACVRLPIAGAGGAEHLYVPLATAGQETPDGVSAPYMVAGQSPVAAAPAQLPSPMLSAFRRPLPPEEFHSMLRARERALSTNASSLLFSQGRTASFMAPKPVFGTKDTFNVCASSACDSFVQAAATAQSVGNRVAIFVDDAAPSGGYTVADLDQVRTLFDQFLYPIDTTAFGRESDINGDSVVVVLLTPRVNALSPDCNATGRVILGYFFGADLLPRSGLNPGSNEAEVFYGLVPDPLNSQCTISKDEANSHLPTTFIHEFQHMISFNQHVLVRGGTAEDTWLNEGLSHFAEELGGREVPDAECPVAGTCEAEFLGQGDLLNAFEYLASPEDFFLIEPGNSTGKLEERGANWLFVRWLADNFATDTILGTDLTQRLLATNQVGSANVTSRTGVSFSTLVGEWQLTNYLDDLPGFSQPAERLRYKTWNFRAVADSNAIPFPLIPDSTSGVGYTHTGVLRAGSGRHVRVVQAPGAGAVDLQLTGPTGTALPNSIAPRIALVRIR
ncbi:MAG TPA: hypothetical protein VGJ36_05640 [Gemmatimonadales bacterium]